MRWVPIVVSLKAPTFIKKWVFWKWVPIVFLLKYEIKGTHISKTPTGYFVIK